MPKLEFHFATCGASLLLRGQSWRTECRLGLSPFPFPISLSYFSFRFWELSAKFLGCSNPNPSHSICGFLVFSIFFKIKGCYGTQDKKRGVQASLPTEAAVSRVPSVRAVRLGCCLLLSQCWMNVLYLGTMRLSTRRGEQFWREFSDGWGPSEVIIAARWTHPFLL